MQESRNCLAIFFFKFYDGMVTLIELVIVCKYKLKINNNNNYNNNIKQINCERGLKICSTIILVCFIGTIQHCSLISIRDQIHSLPMDTHLDIRSRCANIVHLSIVEN